VNFDVSECDIECQTVQIVESSEKEERGCDVLQPRVFGRTRNRGQTSRVKQVLLADKRHCCQICSWLRFYRHDDIRRAHHAKSCARRRFNNCGLGCYLPYLKFQLRIGLSNRAYVCCQLLKLTRCRFGFCAASEIYGNTDCWGGHQNHSEINPGRYERDRASSNAVERRGMSSESRRRSKLWNCHSVQRPNTKAIRVCNAIQRITSDDINRYWVLLYWRRR